ncbi:LysE/ArgO family amino acid transporter [Bacillus safensis]|uniref:LysE/ArgO family amino acid transporter n=1 Tax=Bacillus safensis TaxID=561879 RepID=UPI001BAC3E08|nr:LysE/ArgO family amino acid transporter [Bacillus safensis]MBR0605467.1 amino acid transporter [Bacillus safensis]WJE38263.1 LysE/ArgO family amino acid transporter [Bacillus safensis]WLW68563.1 LysE/ArgO family amino acid transporter [Bacillus safensis]
MSIAIIHGIVLAFGLILPLGAQNVFVFQQGALQPRLYRAMPVVITAALCDTLLIALAVIGVSVVVFTIPVLQIGLYIIGFCFLVYMGWSVWNTSSSSGDEERQKLMPARKQIVFACSVSLLNPHAILDTIGVIGTNSLQYSGAEKLAFTLACIIVSWLWFMGLALLGKMLGKLDTNGKWMNRINKASAVMIWLVALYIGYQLIV